MSEYIDTDIRLGYEINRINPKQLHRLLRGYLGTDGVVAFLQELESYAPDYSVALKMTEFYLGLVKEVIETDLIDISNIDTNSLLCKCLSTLLMKEYT